MSSETYNIQYVRSSNKLSFEFCLFDNKLGKFDLLKNKFKNYKLKFKNSN
jgi:hypothetical protein